MLSGFLMALLGAILPAWGYHRDPPDFAAVGNYFLSLAAGIVAASLVARRIIARRGLRFLLVSSCTLSCLSLAYLALVSPPAPQWWRVAGLLAMGTGAGLLNMALFCAISRTYQSDPAGTVNRGGIWHGLGCLAATALVVGTFYAYTVPTILFLMALVPAIFGGIYIRGDYIALPEGPQATLKQALQDFRTPGAVMFALLLFFQFGNEWSIAGWLPIFLIRRLGISPEGSLWMLSFYWGSLLVGRVAANGLLKIVNHGKLLLWSILLALFGCVILTYTTNRFGANTAILFIGCGFAPIYPLLVEKIGHRFKYFHPGLYNGIFSFAFTGGLMAPGTLGYLAQKFGVGIVMVVPMFGTFMVFVLFLLILLEAKLSGDLEGTKASA